MTDFDFQSVISLGRFFFWEWYRMKLNLFDSHVHSIQSHDGHSTLEELCARALDRGVMGVCVTDHFECDIPSQ